MDLEQADGLVRDETKFGRRECLMALATASAACPLPLGASQAASLAGWDSSWDRALLGAAVSSAERAFDPAELMLKERVGAEYRYHSALRSQTAHPTRESLHFALLLLERGSEADRVQAQKIVARLLNLQETDPASKWYGLWGWYLEEPAPSMQPADWNWADFLGAILLLIEQRHGGALSRDLRESVTSAIHHAAYSVMRRNVSMGYTNIAIKGTFVTLAAADLLGDKALRTYGRERLLRFSAEVDRTGSYNEYNSPTYNRVGIENFTRMRMGLNDEDVIVQVERLEERMWDHFSRRWHVGTRQLAGPMSRCYSTDIGRPLWLQKSLNNAVVFASLDDVRSARVTADAEASYLDFRCPGRFVNRFVEAGIPRMVREVFLAPDGNSHPTQGSTWIAGDASLGSINQGDWWVQRRPVLGWFRDASGGTVAVRMRVMKDDYDFSSSRIYSVQDENRILGVINFQSPGGDRHISLDPIAEGRFLARSLRLQVDVTGGEFRLEEQTSVPFREAPGRRTAVRVVQIGKHRLRLLVTIAGELLQEGARAYETGLKSRALSMSFPWFGLSEWQAAPPREVSWRTTPSAFAVFQLEVLPEITSMADDPGPTSVTLDENPEAGTVKVMENGYPANLSLVAGTTVETAAKQNARFDGGSIGGRAVPLDRLSDTPLAARFRP